MPQWLTHVRLVFFILVYISAFLHTSVQAASRDSNGLVGEWVINAKLSEAVRPEQPEKRNFLDNQNINTSVSVGGLPLPKIGVRQAPMLKESAKHPEVLQCQALKIEESPSSNNKVKRLELTFVGVGEETVVVGEFRGIKTKYNGKSIDQRYETTERKVKKLYEIREDGRLEVTVTIKPDGAAKRIYKQVFDRKQS